MNTFFNLNRSYINGEFVKGKGVKVFEDKNPYTNEVLTEIRLATRKQTEDAIKAAKVAQKEWEKVPKTRAKVIKKAIKLFEKYKSDIIDTLIKESGSTFIKAQIEYKGTMAILKESLKMTDELGQIEDKAGMLPGKRNKVYRKAKGVISSIAPFNFPLHLSMRTIAPALALGNAVVHKPDVQTGIVSGSIIAKIFDEAGLPKGLFNSILTKSSEIGEILSEHEDISLVSFTGSTNAGRKIGSVAGHNLKQVALELGGNSPLVVLDDADMKTAVRSAIMGTFLHQGQICMSVNRIIVHKDRYDEFTDKFVKAAKRVRSGDPAKKRTLVGPIINEKQLEKTLEHIENAKKSGTMMLEGERDGNVVTPYVFKDIKNDSEIAQTELFSPIALIVKADSNEDALDKASNTEYGLSSAIITKNLKRGERYAVELEAGMTHLNEMTVFDAPDMPFGGVKNSGIGRFGNPYIVDEFTELKWITVQKTSLPYNWLK